MTDNDTPVPWFKRSRREFALRDAGHSVKRILMQRWADERGLNADGRPALWKDVAVFDSYSDAESILPILEARGDQKGGEQP